MIELKQNAIVIIQSSTLHDILKRIATIPKAKIEVGMNAVVVEVPDDMFASRDAEAFKAFVAKTIQAYPPYREVKGAT